ncbi:MAG: GNAT family N-acetyltransferase [Rhodoglobus sp.]
MIIRPYQPEDRDRLYDICLLTGANGGDASGLYEVPTLLGEVYVGPYLEFAPDLAWVAELGGEPAGYVLGAADTWSFEMHCEAQWWPKLRKRYPQGSQSSPADSAIVDLITRPPTAEPGVLASYPAHLHIDLLPSLQGRGAGRALIDTLLTALSARGAPGVHLGVSLANVRAVGFYQHLGFSTVRVGPDYFILGKRLDDH